MNLNGLDLNLIRVFDALMAERSVTRAGARIGLSQPAVSAALQRLRQQFNDQLFVRRGNDMVPTPRAEDLAPRARAALSDIERMLEPEGSFDPARIERHFALMGSDFVSMLMMPRLVVRIREAAPGAVLWLRDTSIGDVARHLREDTIDLAIEPRLPPQEGVSCQTLFVSPFLLIAARDNPQLADVPEGAAVPLDLLCRLPHAMRSVAGDLTGVVDAGFRRAGYQRRVSLALPQFEAVALAVAQSEYVAALPSQFAENAAQRLPLSLYRLPVDVPAPEIQMFWHARHDRERAHRWLRDEVVACVAELGLDRTPTS